MGDVLAWAVLTTALCLAWLAWQVTRLADAARDLADVVLDSLDDEEEEQSADS